MPLTTGVLRMECLVVSCLTCYNRLGFGHQRCVQWSFDATRAWAMSWRLHFGIGLTQNLQSWCLATPVADRRHSLSYLGRHVLPYVQTHYLGIVFNVGNRMSITVLRRGETRTAACLSWTNVENLFPSFVESWYM